MSELDYAQCIKTYLPGGNLVPHKYDDIKMTYYASPSTSAQAQIMTVVCHADVDGNLNSQFFTFATPNNLYAVFINVAGEGQAPNIFGYTNVSVPITAGSTAAQVATALRTALDALSDVTATVSTATVTVTNDDAGAVKLPKDSGTGFTFTVTQDGITASDGEGEIATVVIFIIINLLLNLI